MHHHKILQVFTSSTHCNSFQAWFNHQMKVTKTKWDVQEIRMLYVRCLDKLTVNF